MIRLERIIVGKDHRWNSSLKQQMVPSAPPTRRKSLPLRRQKSRVKGVAWNLISPITTLSFMILTLLEPLRATATSWCSEWWAKVAAKQQELAWLGSSMSMFSISCPLPKSQSCTMLLFWQLPASSTLSLKSRLSLAIVGPQIFRTDPWGTRTSQICTVASHPPLKNTFGSVGRHFTEKIRLTWWFISSSKGPPASQLCLSFMVLSSNSSRVLWSEPKTHQSWLAWQSAQRQEMSGRSEWPQAVSLLLLYHLMVPSQLQATKSAGVLGFQQRAVVGQPLRREVFPILSSLPSQMSYTFTSPLEQPTPAILLSALTRAVNTSVLTSPKKLTTRMCRKGLSSICTSPGWNFFSCPLLSWLSRMVSIFFSVMALRVLLCFFFYIDNKPYDKLILDIYVVDLPEYAAARHRLAPPQNPQTIPERLHSPQRQPFARLNIALPQLTPQSGGQSQRGAQEGATEGRSRTKGGRAGADGTAERGQGWWGGAEAGGDEAGAELCDLHGDDGASGVDSLRPHFLLGLPGRGLHALHRLSGLQTQYLEAALRLLPRTAVDHPQLRPVRQRLPELALHCQTGGLRSVVVEALPQARQDAPLRCGRCSGYRGDLVLSRGQKYHQDGQKQIVAGALHRMEQLL